jgi:hypothetical protein
VSERIPDTIIALVGATLTAVLTHWLLMVITEAFAVGPQEAITGATYALVYFLMFGAPPALVTATLMWLVLRKPLSRLGLLTRGPVTQLSASAGAGVAQLVWSAFGVQAPDWHALAFGAVSGAAAGLVFAAIALHTTHQPTVAA